MDDVTDHIEEKSSEFGNMLAVIAAGLGVVGLLVVVVLFVIFS